MFSRFSFLLSLWHATKSTSRLSNIYDSYASVWLAPKWNSYSLLCPQEQIRTASYSHRAQSPFMGERLTLDFAFWMLRSFPFFEMLLLFFLVLAHALTTFDQMEWLIETLVNVSNPNCKNYCRRHDHDHDDDHHHPTLFLPNQMPFSSRTNLSIQAWPLLHGSEFPKRRRSSFGIKEDDMLSHSSGFLRLKYSSGQIIATSLQKLAEEGKSFISDKIHEQNLYYIQSPDFQKTSGGFVIFQLDLLLVREKDPAN